VPPLTGAGNAHELAEVTERVAGGHTESETMPLADTVAVLDVLGEIAEQLGVRVIEGPADLACAQDLPAPDDLAVRSRSRARPRRPTGYGHLG
jgi:hypothetical protein